MAVKRELDYGTSFPTVDLQDGDLFYRTDEDQLYIRWSSSWKAVGAGGGASSGGVTIETFGSALVGSAFSTTTVGSWLDTGVEIIYEAPSDGIILFNIRVRLYHSVANKQIVLKIWDSAVEMDIRADYLSASPAWGDCCFSGVEDVTEGSHTYKLRLYNIAAGTASVYRQTVARTQIEGTFISTDELVVNSGTSFPVSPNDYELFYRTDLHKMYVYDVSFATPGWQEV